jgi:hypothetical protein
VTGRTPSARRTSDAGIVVVALAGHDRRHAIASANEADDEGDEGDFHVQRS